MSGGAFEYKQYKIQNLIENLIYTKRLDWFISGDDGEETFYERLKEDLENDSYPQ